MASNCIARVARSYHVREEADRGVLTWLLRKQSQRASSGKGFQVRAECGFMVRTTSDERFHALSYRGVRNMDYTPSRTNFSLSPSEGERAGVRGCLLSSIPLTPR